MINILGEEYYIDFDVIDDFVIILNDGESLKETETRVIYDENEKLLNEEVLTKEFPKAMEVNRVKFELIKNLIDDLGYNGEGEAEDPLLGAHNMDKMSLSFKIAFNTLHHYGILKSE